MATTDDLIIAIRADMGQLQNQLNSVNAQLLRTQQQGHGASDAIKGMAVQFLSLGAAIEGLKKLVEVNREFGIYLDSKMDNVMTLPIQILKFRNKLRYG